MDAHRSMRLPPDAYDRFLAALDAPARPVRELVEQIRKSRPPKHMD